MEPLQDEWIKPFQTTTTLYEQFNMRLIQQHAINYEPINAFSVIKIFFFAFSLLFRLITFLFLSTLFSWRGKIYWYFLHPIPKLNTHTHSQWKQKIKRKRSQQKGKAENIFYLTVMALCFEKYTFLSVQQF